MRSVRDRHPSRVDNQKFTRRDALVKKLTIALSIVFALTCSVLAFGQNTNNSNTSNTTTNSTSNTKHKKKSTNSNKNKGSANTNSNGNSNR